MIPTPPPLSLPSCTNRWQSNRLCKLDNQVKNCLNFNFKNSFSTYIKSHVGLFFFWTPGLTFTSSSYAYRVMAGRFSTLFTTSGCFKKCTLLKCLILKSLTSLCIIFLGSFDITVYHFLRASSI